MRTIFPAIKTQVTLAPDSIIDAIIPGLAFVEAKLSHCLDAYYQLERYRTRARESCTHMLAREKMVEVCKFYRPEIVWPGTYRVLENLKELRDCDPGHYIYIWSRFD